MSYISPLSAELVGSLDLARRVREGCGGSPLPPVDTWPVKLLDAARVMNVESIKEHNARIEAEADEREG